MFMCNNKHGRAEDFGALSQKSYFRVKSLRLQYLAKCSSVAFETKEKGLHGRAQGLR